MPKVNLTLTVDEGIRDSLVEEAYGEERSISNMLERILRERYATLAERETSGATRTRGDLAPDAVAGGDNSGDAYPESVSSVGASRSASAATATRVDAKPREDGTNGKVAPSRGKDVTPDFKGGKKR